MPKTSTRALRWISTRVLFPIALGLVGFAINCLPIEIYPGVHLVFGGVMAILAALKFGPFAGGIAGLTAGLRTWSLWNQPFPLSAILYGLEGVWVGTYQKRSGKRGPLAAVLAYWLLLGAWLSLAGHIFLFDVPFRLALIMQGRSIINGVLVGILVELIILVSEVIRGRLRYRSEPLRLSLHSLIALVLLTAIALPMLYTSTRNVTDMRERMVNDLASSRSRDVQAIQGETESVLQNFRRGVATAAALFESPDHQPRNQEELSRLLGSMRQLFPEFVGMGDGDTWATGATGALGAWVSGVAGASVAAPGTPPLGFGFRPDSRSISDMSTPLAREQFLQSGGVSGAIGVSAVRARR